MPVAIIVPCWNEEKHLEKTLKRIRACSSDWTIIVSDDGSTDRSVSLAKEHADVVVEHAHEGKGSTARRGCDLAIEKGFTQLVLIDADGQHDPEDISRLLKKLKRKDIVLTYRVGGEQPVVFRIGNWGLNFGTWLLFGKWIKDTQSGFRAFTSKAYEQIRWKATQYDMESEMIARIKNLSYDQIPIKKVYLDNTKGTTVSSGLRIAWKLFLLRLRL